MEPAVETEARSSRAPIDWAVIEQEYRSGQLSIRGLASRHSISEGAVRKQAKAQGWERATADRVLEAVSGDGAYPGTQAKRASAVHASKHDNEKSSSSGIGAQEKRLPLGEYITYVPGPEDESSTQWAGHVFHANVPKLVTHPGLIERARANRFFKVGAFKPSDVVEAREQPDLPKTSEQYRAHAIRWLKKLQSVDELDRKWRGEETLRMSCGVGADDIDFLMGLMRAIRKELRSRDQI